MCSCNASLLAVPQFAFQVGNGGGDGGHDGECYTRVLRVLRLCLGVLVRPGLWGNAVCLNHIQQQL